MCYFRDPYKDHIFKACTAYGDFLKNVLEVWKKENKDRWDVDVIEYMNELEKTHKRTSKKD